MTVAELVRTLSSYSPDLPVWHDGGGDPYCAGEITAINTVRSEGRTLMGHKGRTPAEWVELS